MLYLCRNYNIYDIYMQNLTSVEKRLIRNIMADPNAGTPKLAERVGMSTTACWRKIEKLQQLGIIKGFVANINWRRLGYELEVSLRITLDKTQKDAFETFLVGARKIKEVNEIQTFLGRVDVRLNILAKNLEHYQSIYRDEILKLPCISEVEALMLISDIKKTNTLPV